MLLYNFSTGTKGTLICDYRQHEKCLQYARSSLLNELRTKMNCGLTTTSCNCLPLCMEVTYDFDISKDEFQPTKDPTFKHM